MTNKNEGEKLVDDLKNLKANKKKDKFINSTPVLVIRGIWLFAEGASLIVTSVFAIHQAHFETLPTWGSYSLTIAGVLVLVPAGLLLSKFFRGVAKA